MYTGVLTPATGVISVRGDSWKPGKWGRKAEGRQLGKVCFPAAASGGCYLQGKQLGRVCDPPAPCHASTSCFHGTQAVAGGECRDVRKGRVHICPYSYLLFHPNICLPLEQLGGEAG